MDAVDWAAVRRRCGLADLTWCLVVWPQSFITLLDAISLNRRAADEVRGGAESKGQDRRVRARQTWRASPRTRPVSTMPCGVGWGRGR